MELSLARAGVCARMPLFVTTEKLIAALLAFAAALRHTYGTYCEIHERKRTKNLLNHEDLLHSGRMRAQH